MMHNAIVFVLFLVLAALTAAGRPAELTEEERIEHVLNRLGFGPRPGDMERIGEAGLSNYIERQLHPERIDDSRAEARLGAIRSVRMSIDEIFRVYPNPSLIVRRVGLERPPDQDDPAAARQRLQTYMRQNGLLPPQQLLQELQAHKILRAVYSERQLQEVMTDFWFNHFNVFWGKGANRWLTTSYEMEAIRPNALGKFKDLVLATAKHPAMLFYLDNHLSSVPQIDNPAMRRPNAGNNRRGINENYARELMELHTLGVDGGYTERDVQEVARAFTGWSIDRPQQAGTFVFRPVMHDRGEKVVLGQTIPAGGGRGDGERVIEILTGHPSTARFIAAKLVRRFVSDDPPESLVDRVAAVYMDTGGDIREMLRTIFFSGEFMSSDAYGQKTKSAFEYAVSAIRALGGDTNGAQTARAIARMGQPLYQHQAPTGYPDRAAFWMNHGMLLERLNFAVSLSENRGAATRINLAAAGFADARAAALHIGSPEFQKR